MTTETKTQHTAGPWKTYERPDRTWFIEDGKGRSICKVAHYLTEENAANVNLIAAAPDLLAACKALLPEGWDYGIMDHMPGVKIAREAIAKAEGRK